MSAANRGQVVGRANWRPDVARQNRGYFDQMNRWRVGLAVTASVALGVAIVFAVREDGAQPSPDEQFADSLCAVALPRTREMLEVFDDVVHTRASPGRDDGWFPLYASAFRAREIALQYRDDVSALRPPDTTAGRKAAQYLDFVSQDPLKFVMDMIEADPRTPEGSQSGSEHPQPEPPRTGPRDPNLQHERRRDLRFPGTRAR